MCMVLMMLEVGLAIRDLSRPAAPAQQRPAHRVLPLTHREACT